MLIENPMLESRAPRLWTVSTALTALVLLGVVASVSVAPSAAAEEKPSTRIEPLLPADPCRVSRMVGGRRQDVDQAASSPRRYGAQTIATVEEP